MAETIIIERTITHTKHDGTVSTQVWLQKEVRSIRGNRIDVSVIRDFVRGLDAADVPGNSYVTVHNSGGGHPNSLLVQWEINLSDIERDPE